MNRPTSVTLPGSTVLGYGYDEDGNLTSLTQDSGTTTYGYDDADRVTSMIDRAGTRTVFGYDAANDRTDT